MAAAQVDILASKRQRRRPSPSTSRRADAKTCRRRLEQHGAQLRDFFFPLGARRAAYSPLVMSGLSALRRSGRFMVMVSKPWSMAFADRFRLRSNGMFAFVVIVVWYVIASEAKQSEPTQEDWIVRR